MTCGDPAVDLVGRGPLLLCVLCVMEEIYVRWVPDGSAVSRRYLFLWIQQR